MRDRMTMESVADEVSEILRRVWKDHGKGESFEEFMAEHANPDEEARAKLHAEITNRERGKLNEEDGYNCQKCLNRGKIWQAAQVCGHWQIVPVICDCERVRLSIRRLKASGLMSSLRRLSEFEATEPWQQAMLQTAKDYLAADHSKGQSLFLGGAVGSGKTMLGSAVCRELLHSGHEVRYMPWVTESARLKNLATEEDQDDEIAKYRQAEYLYIDDLFKPVPGRDGPSAADVRLAYDIINYRVINKLPMIISSELYLTEMMQYDEATISRLWEMCKGHTVNVTRGQGRNFRMRGEGEMV